MYGQIDYQQALLNASKSMIRVKDPITLLRLITRFVDRQIGATHVGVLLFDRRRDSFVLIDSKGETGRRIPIGYIRIPRDNPVVRYFQQKKNGSLVRQEALVLYELEHLQNFEIHVNKKEKSAIELHEIRKQMELLRASICVPSFHKNELVAVLVLGDKLSGERYYDQEIDLFVTLANDVAMAVKNAELIKDLTLAVQKEHQLLMETASALVSAIEARDRYTKGHSERVSHYSLVVAVELIEQGIVPAGSEFLEAAELSGLLHDVGKIGIKDEILNKPARLTEQEYGVMKAHVKIGANILKPITGLKGLADGVLYHHERWDGKGYPYGLKGEEIPLMGRIVSVVDSYDTMVTDRPYSKGKTPEEAFVELRKCAGGQFDPKLVEVFYGAYKSGHIHKRRYKAYDFPQRH
jgi:HD-GYP domain-containing protein (c-di-GMP phosphodiesterase class II)